MHSNDENAGSLRVRLHGAGTVDDLYQLQSPTTLHVVSKVSIGGRTETTLQVTQHYDNMA